MAGHYYYDPRPFYGHNNHTGLMPLDELFYGRYEPAVPYWQDQRMAPLSMFEDNYYGGPGLKQQMVRRPEIMHQQYVPQRGENNFMPYARPELVRDDMYTDMYRRSPYNFNYNNYGRDGVALAPGMHPEILRQQQQVPRQSQDDTWVHTMSAPPPFGHGHQSFRGLPEPPPGTMAPRAAFGNGIGNGNGNGNGISTGTGIDQYRPMSNGNDQYQMPVNNQNQSSHNNSNSNSHSNGNSIGSKQSLGVSSQQNGSFGTQGKSLSQVGKSGVMQTSTMSKQLTGSNNNNNHNNSNSNSNAKRYNNDSSSSDSEDDDDEYHNNGGKWSTVKSGTKHGHSGSATSAHGHKVDSHSHGYQSNSKNSSVSMSSKKSSNGSYGSSTPGKHSSGGKHSSSQSKISKLLRFQDDSSSSEDDDESYGHGHSKKGSSKGSHQTHGSHVSIFQPNSYASQPKQMQFSSQSKSVELKVPICCDNCERKVRSCLEKMEGVESVLCDQWNRKVIVYGNLKAENVLKRVRRVKKTSELWQQAKQPQQQQLQQLRLY